MKFSAEDLQQTFEENSDGLTPEEFLKDRVKLSLQTLVETDNGRKLYRQAGPYWENVYPVFKKYAPELLAEYERQAGPFDYFNEAVKAEYDYKDDLLNFMAATAYQEMRYDTMQRPEDVHIIELDGNDDFAYIPNQNIDQAQYLGREE
ncbi:MAG: hypothetical protein RDU14_16655 [Melioribacteraceae bacterium]|nr:hypothetical protein [Melioribacteraceae bacterium]